MESEDLNVLLGVNCRLELFMDTSFRLFSEQQLNPMGGMFNSV